MKEKYLAVWRKGNGEDGWRFSYSQEQAEEYLAEQCLDPRVDFADIFEVNGVEHRKEIVELKNKLKHIQEITME